MCRTGVQIITGSYLMPRDRGGDEVEEEDGQRFEFVKDYKFNITHYVRHQGRP